MDGADTGFMVQNYVARYVEVTFEQFRDAARTTGLVPVLLDFPLGLDTPVSAFAKVRRGPFAFLLESAPVGGETWARYTYIGTEPRRAWRARDGIVEDWTPDLGWHGSRSPADPLADIETVLTEQDTESNPAIAPFCGGAVGYFGYDMARHIERLGPPPPRADDVPDALFIFTRTVVVIDNLHGIAHIVVSVPVRTGMSEPELRTLYDEAFAEAEDVRDRLRRPLDMPPPAREAAEPVSGSTSIGRPEFLGLVGRIKEHIFAGDVFQVLLSRRIEMPADFDAFDLYRALRVINPSPFMYHLVLDDVEIVGSSPELLVRLEDGRVTLRPIAGTRPRSPAGAEPQDSAVADELLADPKEQAEHVMLVDLGRNDLGRVSKFGTVRTTSFMQVEKYSHVFHIVSQVEGQIRDGVSAMDIVRATFPAGTMTGAPKVRAMEIIDELEPVRRGPYAGAIGYISAGGTRMELAITIRSCIIHRGVASVQAGAGIVADSVPEREWDETENKARAVLTAIAQAKETHAQYAVRSTQSSTGSR